MCEPLSEFSPDPQENEGYVSVYAQMTIKA